MLTHEQRKTNQTIAKASNGKTEHMTRVVDRRHESMKEAEEASPCIGRVRARCITKTR